MSVGWDSDVLSKIEAGKTEGKSNNLGREFYSHQLE